MIEIIDSIVRAEFVGNNLRLSAKTKNRICSFTVGYFLRYKTTMKIADISKQCGANHHSWVVYSCKVITRLQQSDKELKKILDSIDRKLAYMSFDAVI